MTLTTTTPVALTVEPTAALSTTPDASETTLPDTPEASQIALPSTPDAGATLTATVTPTVVPVIVIDPGHGGKDTGAVGENGLLEKDLNLTIALQLAALLRAQGYHVLLTHSSDRALNEAGADLNGDGTVDQDDELQARVDFANHAGATLFVSVHNNSDPRSHSVRGTTVYYCADRSFSAKSERLAALLEDRIVAEIDAAGYNTTVRGARDDRELGKAEGHLYLLGPKNKRIARPSVMPAATGETLFLSNPADATQLQRPEILAAIARGYLHGIEDYLAGK